MPFSERAQPSRASRVSSKILKIAGAGCMLAIIAFISFQKAGSFYLRNWVLVAAIIFFTTGMIAALVRAFTAVFGESQYRTGEVILTFFAAGTAAAIANAIFLPMAPGWARDGIGVVIVLTTFALTGMGSVWAWSVAGALDVTEPWPRIKLLIAGWLVIPGIFTLIFFALGFVLSLIDGKLDGVFGCLLAMVLAIPLYLPGIKIELRRGKAARNKRALEPQKAAPMDERVAQSLESSAL